MSKTVIITGCSSGYREATAECFAGNGWNVSATMFDSSCETGIQLSQLPNVLVPNLDVRDRQTIDRAVAATLEEFRSIDVVVNNAGYILRGPAEFATKDEVLQQLETNLYGPLAVTQAVLPHFRSKGSGLFINVSSMVGRYALPFRSTYVASKHALEGLSEALNLELVPLGMRVKIIEPGRTQTNWKSDAQISKRDGDDIYRRAAEITDENFPKVLFDVLSSAEDVARVIYDAATDCKKTLRYPVGEDTRLLNAIRKRMSRKSGRSIC